MKIDLIERNAEINRAILNGEPRKLLAIKYGITLSSIDKAAAQHTQRLDARAQLAKMLLMPHDDWKVALLDLSNRTKNGLADERIVLVKDLLRLSENELIKSPNLGRKCIDEIVGVLSGYGLFLRSNNTEYI